MKKTCSKCGEIKPLGEFHKNKNAQDGYSHTCKECACARARKWYEANKVRVAAIKRVWYGANKGRRATTNRAWEEAHKDRRLAANKAQREANPDRTAATKKAYALKRHFNISLTDYDEMLEAQDSSCAICGRTIAEEGRRLAVDHDHETGEVRGLLCGNCNQGLGRFMHDQELLHSAIAYLEQWAE